MNYSCLTKQSFTDGTYTLVPIRMEDRWNIMKWRNEQIYHLRQAKPLTREDQDKYYHEVVAKIFDEECPEQILFSFLKDGKCIGYGGLVHINWIDNNAELSFIMDTALEKEYFAEIWTAYLKIMDEVAFKELKLHKLTTYAFDIKPHIYPVLENAGFVREATLKEHCRFQGKYISVVLHGKINSK